MLRCERYKIASSDVTHSKYRSSQHLLSIVLNIFLYGGKASILSDFLYFFCKYFNYCVCELVSATVHILSINYVRTFSVSFSFFFFYKIHMHAKSEKSKKKTALLTFLNFIKNNYYGIVWDRYLFETVTLLNLKIHTTNVVIISSLHTTS